MATRNGQHVDASLLAFPGPLRTTRAMSESHSEPERATEVFSSPAGSGRPRLTAGVWPLCVIVLALGFTLATGPFRAPDEYHHFFRAYEISEGRLVAKRVGNEFLGDYLPRSLDQIARVSASYPDSPPTTTERQHVSAARLIKLKAKARDFLPFPGAALHAPLVYVPAACGIAIGRLLHAGPLLLFYFARCANAIVAGGLLGWALRRSARSAPFLASLALLPMCLFQVGTVTADAVTFALSLFWSGEILRARAADDADLWPRSVWIFMAAVLSLLRFPYPLLGLLVLAVPRLKLGRTRAEYARFLFFFFVALIAPCLCWVATVQHLRVQMRPLVEVDPAGQLHFVLTHPFHFLHLVGSEMARAGIEYLRELIGVFGWLTFRLPNWIYIAVIACLVVTICSSDPKLRLTIRFRLFSFGLAITGLLLTALIVYMAWDAVGAARIEGWQGRYAIPFLPLGAFAIANGWLRNRRGVYECAWGVSVVASISAIALLARATYF
jgi:uncharacterized membrane protein